MDEVRRRHRSTYEGYGAVQRRLGGGTAAQRLAALLEFLVGQQLNVSVSGRYSEVRAANSS